MQIKLTDTDQFKFTRPEFSFGQQVETDDGQVGYIVGLDFYPETRVWAYGIYIVSQRNELIEELWYEANQLRLLEQEPTSPHEFPAYHFNLLPHQNLQATS